MEPAAPHRQSARAQRATDPDVEERRLGPAIKNRTEGRTIVFVDESGLSQRPHRCRTWAPRGHTPVLEYNFNWRSLSAVAGLTAWNFYFRLYPGAVKSPQVVDFLTALLRHIRQPLILVWDRLSAHRSGMVRDYLSSLKGRIEVK